MIQYRPINIGQLMYCLGFDLNSSLQSPMFCGLWDFNRPSIGARVSAYWLNFPFFSQLILAGWNFFAHHVKANKLKDGYMVPKTISQQQTTYNLQHCSQGAHLFWIHIPPWTQAQVGSDTQELVNKIQWDESEAERLQWWQLSGVISFSCTLPSDVGQWQDT